jgi:para-aminobenzoate synthetase component 1
MVEKEIHLPGFDPLVFFAKLSKKESRPAFFTSAEWTIITWNPVKTIRGKRASVIEKLKRRKKFDSALPFCGGAIGYFDYDGRGLFHWYNHALLWNGKKVMIVGDANFEQSVLEIHARPTSDAPLPAIAWRQGINERWYRKAFERVKRSITNGEYYQLNLTYPFFAKSTADHRRLFLELLRKNPAPCASYIENGKHAILSLSPERFVTIGDEKITTCPIKGTRPRGRNATEDKKMANDLLKSEKEAAELNMITDLLRNDIGKVSLPGTVKVLKHREFQKNPSVWHTYSVIEGKIDPAITPIDAFSSMFPGGSVTGCPKIAAVKDIRRLERYKRGAYCGSMVMLSDNGHLDSTILIRTVVAWKKKLSLGVGGGIVADSEWKKEFDETLRKATSFTSFVPRRVFRNGKELSLDDRSVHALDPMNRRARGLFETMLAQNGKIPDLAMHLARLQASSEAIRMLLPASPSRLKEWIGRALKRERGSLRLKLVCTKHDVFIDVRPYVPDPSWSAGVAVTVTKLTRKKPEVKALPYHREAKAFHAAVKAGFHEALLLRSDGRIHEAAYSNLFWIKKGILKTSDQGMLLGIMRQHVLRFARSENITVQFQMPTLNDLQSADEIFLTRSLAGIVPVIRIDQAIIGSGKIGKVTQRLQEAFKDR